MLDVIVLYFYKYSWVLLWNAVKLLRISLIFWVLLLRFFRRDSFRATTVKTSSFQVLYLMVHELWGFLQPDWWEQALFHSLYECLIISGCSFYYFGLYATRYLRGPSADLWSSFMQLSPLRYSSPWTLVFLVSLDSRQSLFNSHILGYTWIPPPHATDWKLSKQ